MKTRSIVFAAVGLVLALALAGAGQQSADEIYKSGLYEEEVGGDLQKAIAIYQDLLKRFPGSREVAAKAQLHIGLCYEKLGTAEARKAFQKVIDDYPEQAATVGEARAKLSLLLGVRSAAGAAESGPSVRLIWTGPDAVAAARTSPDGMFLSFVDRETGNLCVRELASGKTTAVTSQDPSSPFEFAGNTCWSPDGKTLAYGWFNKDNAMELRTIGADGSAPRVLYKKKDEWTFPVAWSPDGRAIVIGLVKNFYNRYDIALVSVEDGSLKVLGTPKLLKTTPKNITFSPDSRYVIADLPQGDNDPKHDIFAFPVDGGQPTRVVQHPANDAVLEWIPGSDDLLLISDRTGTQDAWLVKIVDGRSQGEPRLVRKNLGWVACLGVDRQGSLFYRTDTEMKDIALAAIDIDKRAFIEPPKTLPQSIVGVNSHPQWSPDGKSLAFLSDRKTESSPRDRQAIWIWSAESGETRELVTDLQSLSRPRWAPDGRSIFIIGSDGKTFWGLHRVDVETGRTTFIIDSEPGANIKFIAPAPDGRTVYYSYFEFAKKRCRLMSVDVASRQTRELYQQEAPPDLAGVSVSPDGRQLVFGTKAPDGSWVLNAMALPGGPVREITKSKAAAWGLSVSGAFCWTPDGTRILFFKDAAKGKDKKSELCVVPAAGGEFSSLGLIVNGTPSVLSLNPDGRRLAFAFSQPSAEVWVMENFLPVGR